MNNNADLPLFAWGLARPTAEVVVLAEFREKSPRWLLEIRPRSETVEAALHVLSSTLGMVDPASVSTLRPRRRA